MIKLFTLFFSLVKSNIITILLVSSIYAQSKLTIFGGVNSSKIQYNDNTINNRINISSRNGFNIGFEYPISRFIAGVSYLQRGSKLEDNTLLNIGGVDYKINIDGYEVFNYLSTHIYYPISHSSKINSFMGLQFGSSLGGISLTKLKFTDYNSSQSDELKLKPKDFDVDVGLHIGAEYMLNNNFGFRASCFLGMADVKKTLIDSLNYKNNTFNISALYKVKRTKKRTGDNKKIRQIDTNSKLLLPENAIKLQLEKRFGSTISQQSRLTLGYGIKDFLTIEISKTNFLNTSDFSFRTNYLNRLIKNLNYPINIIYESIISTHPGKPVIFDDYDKLSFLNQIIFEYKLKQNIIFSLAPTFIHINLVDTKLKPKGYPWDVWFAQSGLHWFYKNHVQFYANLSNQITQNEISSAVKTGFKTGIQYSINSIEIDLSVSNLYHLNRTALAEDIGILDNDQKLRFGFQVNKIFK